MRLKAYIHSRIACLPNRLRTVLFVGRHDREAGHIDRHWIPNTEVFHHGPIDGMVLALASVGFRAVYFFALVFLCSAASAQTLPLGPAKVTFTGSEFKLTVGDKAIAGGRATGAWRFTSRPGWIECEIAPIDTPAMALQLWSTGRNALNAPARVGSILSEDGQYVFGLLPIDDYYSILEMDTDADHVYVRRAHRLALYCCKADHATLLCLQDEIQRAANQYRSAILRLNPENGEPYWFLMPDGGGGDRPKSSDIIAACRELGIRRVVLSAGFWLDAKNPDYPCEPFGWNRIGDKHSRNYLDGWSVAEFAKDLNAAGILVELHVTCVHWDRDSALHKLHPDWWQERTAGGDVGHKLSPKDAGVCEQLGKIAATSIIKLGTYAGQKNAIKGIYNDQVTPDSDEVHWSADMTAAFIAGIRNTLRDHGYELTLDSTGLFRWADSYLGTFDIKLATWGLSFSGSSITKVNDDIPLLEEQADPSGLVKLSIGWFNIGHTTNLQTGKQEWVTGAQLNQWLALPYVKGFSMSYSEWLEIKSKPDYYGAILVWRYPTKESLIKGLMDGSADGNAIQPWTNERTKR